jgi:hypothetical protein
MRTHVFDPISNTKPTNHFLSRSPSSSISLALFLFCLNNNVNHKARDIVKRALSFDNNKTSAPSSSFPVGCAVFLLHFLSIEKTSTSSLLLLSKRVKISDQAYRIGFHGHEFRLISLSRIEQLCILVDARERKKERKRKR